MGKAGTLAATGGVAAALVAAGLAAGRRRGSLQVPAAAAGAAAAYLAGTYGQNTPLFGAVARPRLASDDDRFALTFDDGPDPRHTPAIARLLAERDQRATFFVLGRHARAHPDLVRLLEENGHEIASHGDDHRLLAFASARVAVAQLVAAEEAVRAAVGHPPAPLFRPPHGVRSPWLVRVSRRRGYVVCGWDGRVCDTAQPGSSAIVRRVERLLRPGAIVLLHDGDGSGGGGSRRQTVEAFPAILDAAERLGLRSVPLGDLLDPRVCGVGTHAA